MDAHQAMAGSQRDPQDLSEDRRAGRSKGKNVPKIAAIATLFAALLSSFYFGSEHYSAPNAFGEYGIVGNVSALAQKQAPDGALTPALFFTLQGLIAKNQLNQDAAISHGGLSAVKAVLEANSTGLVHSQALKLLSGFMKDNPGARDSAYKEGVLAKLVELIGSSDQKNAVELAAAALAESAADTGASRKKKIGSEGAIEALFVRLDAGKHPGDKTGINIAWALANLLADSPPNQALLLALGGPELLTKLMSSGPDQRITQPALYAVGNSAAKDKASQDALQEAGALEALVKMIEEGMAGFKSQASQPFHTEVLEHVAELQRNDPTVRAALAEVGGLEELLGIIETGSKIKGPGSGKDKQLVLVEGEEGEEELHSIRNLVRDLQDEVDTEAGLMADMKLPSLGRGPSPARILHKPKLLSTQGVLSVAAWALSNVITDNPANQDAAREAGAVEALVKLLEGAEDASVAKSALGAISSLVQGNPTNKAAVRKANGVQGLVKLLASNPADKEVLQATAKALKQMTAERPVLDVMQRSGSRWLRVLSRQASAFVFERLGIQVSPSVFAILLVLGLLGSIIGLLTSCIVGGLRSGSRQKPAKKIQ